MRKARYALEFAAVWLGSHLIQLLPLTWMQAIARFLGQGAYYLGVARKTTLGNLAMVLPEMPEAERRGVARKAYAQFATTMVELAYMPALGPEKIAAQFEFKGLEILDAAKAAGKGAVCHSAHYGNWEWMGAALIQRGYPMTFLIGTQSNPMVDKLFNEHRAKVGVEFVRIKSFRDSVKALKQGRFLALLGDQDGDKYGRFVEFFGRPVSTHVIGASLALKTGAAVFFGVPERLDARHHFLEVKTLPGMVEGKSEDECLLDCLQAYNDHLEAAIRRRPEHWLWMHRRWQTIPAHRVSGEERERVDRGELYYDARRRLWIEKASGQVVNLSTWNPH